jgi:hypothetical protein
MPSPVKTSKWRWRAAGHPRRWRRRLGRLDPTSSPIRCGMHSRPTQSSWRSRRRRPPGRLSVERRRGRDRSRRGLGFQSLGRRRASVHELVSARKTSPSSVTTGPKFSLLSCCCLHSGSAAPLRVTTRSVRAYVDRGYRGHDLASGHVFVSGQRPGITSTTNSVAAALLAKTIDLVGLPT